MGNKQEELEAIVWHESYDVVAITEMWWDELNDWSATMDGYKLFRRDSRGDTECIDSYIAAIEEGICFREMRMVVMAIRSVSSPGQGPMGMVHTVDLPGQAMIQEQLPSGNDSKQLHGYGVQDSAWLDKSHILIYAAQTASFVSIGHYLLLRVNDGL
ncbi:rna-directed dna polymerase from mobile element jockey-like [Limosa lapponica baueri]|uniref:Rna-directed dna polymerase from mobile element jockey-like n=1 Tax=Limosa lapponica baueri TaxID=1758121 RepID=A0A2I0U1N5_LIMLA|nr:rna-directed dna polymerase from mobile element jockey-like [Limosa lapponica baueri]